MLLAPSHVGLLRCSFDPKGAAFLPRSIQPLARQQDGRPPPHLFCSFVHYRRFNLISSLFLHAIIRHPVIQAASGGPLVFAWAVDTFTAGSNKQVSDSPPPRLDSRHQSPSLQLFQSTDGRSISISVAKCRHAFILVFRDAG